MGMMAVDYLSQLQALLPSGRAWATRQTSALALLLLAWADEFTRVDLRCYDLVNEADPRITYELLADYERIFGLPTDCMYGISQTVQQRRNALISQMIGTGGQSRAYFIALVLASGFTITITEFNPYTVGMTVIDPILGSDWAYAWQVNSVLNTVINFIVTGGVDEPLSIWGNNMLECLINRLKPTHTIVIFSYT